MNPAPSLDSSRTFGYIQKIIKMNVSKVRGSKDLEIPMIISKKLLNKREGAG